MSKRMRMVFVVAGLTAGLGAIPMLAQDDSKMSDKKMSGKGMSKKSQMDMMDKMSADEKAAMFDKMSEKDRMAAMKMGGHDMGKMSSQEKMSMKDKMTAQEKADMFDKMPMDKRMSMMRKKSSMHSDSDRMIDKSKPKP